MHDIDACPDKKLGLGELMFKQPRAFTTILPGNLHYLAIHLPGVNVVTEELNCLPTMVTTKGICFPVSSDPEEYSTIDWVRCCALYLNSSGIVSALVYMGTESVSMSNLSCLVGLHESFLNSAVASYEAQLIPDWIPFLRQGWAFGLYHDRFPEFLKMMEAMMTKDEGMLTVIKSIADAMATSPDATSAFTAAHEAVGRGGENLPSTTKAVMEHKVLEFLSRNRDILSMYLTK